ncbi:MAG: alpha/beta hydrolase [Alphaproteobacteria bacterium]|nr:alpha/beta hydrolase [Alphaproteobacteria bacterium]
MTVSPQMPGPTAHSYFSQRLRLHYVDWGNPGAPPLLLLHGGRDHCRNWDWVAEAMRGEWHILAPDLRGHGDSQWAPGGSYNMADYVYDVAQLLHQSGRTPVSIVGHSLGGAIALAYAGTYPQHVSRLVAIEGLGLPPKLQAERARKSAAERMIAWIDELRGISGRQPRRYPSLQDAYRRMQEENPHLSPAQALHLTQHGVNRNEDGTYSWKFDNYVRLIPPFGATAEEVHTLWANIDCPTLLIRGTESWASDPVEDGRIRHFKRARRVNIEGAGHWSQHDRLTEFLKVVRAFLEE